MTERSECRECGAMTVSGGAEPLCFGCQIQRGKSAPASADTFFFDEGEGSPEDEVRARVEGQIPGVRIENEIGRGGMGVVFKGVQEKLERDVAIKILALSSSLEVAFVTRFLNEAKAMARLHHPHIVAIHDFGRTESGLSYIVMEYIEGTSLRVLLKEGKVTPESGVGIVADVCEALAYAHERDIVHRDMKPDNVLVDRQGRAKIADFGIAKLAGSRHVERLTRTHQILGTPLYMAPEQVVEAHHVDHRADLYAVGVMLHEILTGSFPGAEVAPPSKGRPLDPRLDPLVIGLLQKRPEDRLADSLAVARSLRQIATGWTPEAPRRGLFGRLFGR